MNCSKQYIHTGYPRFICKSCCMLSAKRTVFTRKLILLPSRNWHPISAGTARMCQKLRQDVSEAVRELEGMGCLEVVRTRSRNGHQMRARPPHEWLAVGETRHVGKTLHEGNSRRSMSGNSDEKRRQNTTHKRKKETNQKKTVSRIGISDSYADDGDRSEFTEEENRRLDEDGWDDLSI